MKKINNFFHKDEWLSKILKKNTYSISNPMKKEIIYPKKSEFVFTKINKKKKRVINFFLLNKFKKINSNIIFAKKINPNKNILIEDLRNAFKKDLNKLQKISAKNLIKSRFNIDKRISKKKSETIKKEWVKNFFLKKRGNALLVFEKERKIAGFILLIFKKKDLIIDLIALHKIYQNKGFGKNLINYIEFKYKDKFEKIKVGTQSNNPQSIKFYKKMGFKKIEEFVVLHKHI